MKTAKLSFLLFLLSVFVFAQNTSRIFKEASLKNDDILQVKVNDGLYKIKFYTKKIVETTFIPTGEVFTSSSHAVVLKSKSNNIKLKEDEKY